MKALFQAIRRSDRAKVEQLLDADPSRVHSTAKAPPKKDDGQSPLQVAFKTGQFDIVDLLIDRGADVNFTEKSAVNEWRAPVIHDAIRAAIFSSRYRGAGGVFIHTKEDADRAFASLTKLVQAGADVRARDSYGNNCLMRAALDAHQIVSRRDDTTRETVEDLSRVFGLLLAQGADPDEVTPERESVAKAYAGTPVEPLLRRPASGVVPPDLR
jgi:ankyrin repeat protein